MIQEQAPQLLTALRAQSHVTDWRRHKALPLVVTWERRLLSEGESWSLLQQLEARALLAKAQANPIHMAELLCSLACVAGSDLSWIRSELKTIFSSWEQMENFGFVTKETELAKYRVKIALKNALNHFPNDRIFNECLAIFLGEESGPPSALAHLEGALAKGAPVDDVLFWMVQKSLIKPANAALIRFCASISPSLQKRMGLHWHAFLLRRSVSFASLLVMKPLPGWLDLIDPKLIEAHCDFRKTIDQILLDLSYDYQNMSAAAFLRLAKVDVFWVSALPGAEEARQKLTDAMFKAAEGAANQVDRLKILLSLYQCIPRTLHFWTDQNRRIELSKRILSISDDLPNHYGSMIRARFSSALGDHVAAAQNFLNCAKESPGTRGPSSYVDFQSVKDVISIPTTDMVSAWPTLNYEILNSGNPSDEPMIIVTANDRYFDLYLEKYLRKLGHLCAVGRIHLHLFGEPASTKLLIRKFSAHIAKYQISFSYEGIVVDQPYFFATGRFLRIQEWTERFSSPIIMTDIDNLWGQKRNGSPLSFLRESLADADVGLDLRSRVVVQNLSKSPIPGNRYPSPDPWAAVWAGKIFLRGNRASSRFAEILSRVTHRELQKASLRNPKANWFIDQNILSATYAYARRYCPDIKFADLSDEASGQGQHWLGLPDHIVD